MNVVPKALWLGAYGCMGVPILSYQTPGGSVGWLFSLAQDRTYIGGIECDERNVALVNVEKIARALKLSLSELFVACDCGCARTRRQFQKTMEIMPSIRGAL